jgi:VanZ family protein
LDFLTNFKKDRQKLLVGLVIAILFGVFFFGLRPKDYTFSNGVNWILERPGIRFSKYGIAYTDPFVESIEEGISKLNGFSIIIAFKPESFHEGGFNFILSIHNGKNDEQLLVGQWRSYIIIMNGDDYPNKRKTPRIVANILSHTPRITFLTVSTNKEGTKVYVGSQLTKTNSDLRLKFPQGDKTRLILGNSVYGKHSWNGEIYGLAFYDYPLNVNETIFHTKRWQIDQNLSFAEKSKPAALYLFDEKRGKRAFDYGKGKVHLEIPSRMRALEKNILSPPWIGSKLNRNGFIDIIVNILGFIPLGFILSATLLEITGTSKKPVVLITVVSCFILSLTIEIIQAWIPSRSSSMLDLMFNTGGALIGATIYLLIIRLRVKRKTGFIW